MPCGKSLFPWGKSKMSRRKSRFPCGKSHFLWRKSKMACRKSHFPWRKSKIPTQEIAFPFGKNKIPHRIGRTLLAGAVRFLASHENEANLIHAAFSDDEVAVARRLHVAHDAATARDRPALELFGFDVEPYQHVGPDRRFDVPDGAVEIGDPVGLRSR